jgi:hypothetical protein
MPVRAVCPECGATTSLDDPTSSPTLTCHQCGGTVTIPTTARAGPPPLPKAGPPPLRAPTPAAAAAGGFEVLEDSADSTVAVAEPPRARRPAKKAAPPPDEEEYEVLQDVGDDEDVVVEVSVAADDEDDEVEMDVGVPRMRAFVGNFEPGDRPLPKRKARGSGSGLKVVGLVLVALLLVGGGAAGVFFLWPDKEEGSPGVVEGNPPDGGNAGAGNVPGPRPKDSPPPKDAPMTLRLPGKATDVCMGNSGRHLLVHCGGERKLVIVDLAERTIAKEIDTAGPETLIAAGADRFYLADVRSRQIRRHTFTGFAQDKETTWPGAGDLQAIALGSASVGPALVLSASPDVAGRLSLLEQDGLTPHPVTWLLPPNWTVPANAQVRAAGGGGGWTISADGPTPPVRAAWDGDQVVVRQDLSVPATAGVVAPSADNEFFFGSFGRVLSGVPPQSKTPVWVPSDQGPFGVEVRNLDQAVGPIELSVRERMLSEELATVPNVPRPPAPGGPLSLDQAIHFSLTAKTFAVVAADGAAVNLIPLDLRAEIVKKSPMAVYQVKSPPILFKPGETYRFTPDFITGQKTFTVRRRGAKYEGLTAQPNGQVEWAVPTEFPMGQVKMDFVSGSWSYQYRIFTLAPTKFARPKTKDTPPPPKKTPDKKSPDPMPPVVVDPIAPGAKLVNPLPERTPITAPTLTDPFPVDLGGPVRDICVGGGGRYLIAHVPRIRRLVIFDVSAVKVAGTVGLGADNILFAAGMAKLLVVYPEEKQVLRYGLPDGKLELDAELDVRPKPVAAAMGSATAGPLVLGGPVTQNNASKLALTFIDVETLKEVRVDRADGDLRIGFGAAVHLRVSADGQTVATWYRQLQPSGIQLVRLAGNTLTGVHKAVAVGHVIPGPTGVFTEKGMYDAKGEPVGRREVSLPATHGTDFLTIADAANNAKTVAVWRGGDRPAMEFTTLPGFDGKKDPFERDNPALALDKRLFLVPDANVLVVVPPVGDRFILYPLAPAKK